MKRTDSIRATLTVAAVVVIGCGQFSGVPTGDAGPPTSPSPATAPSSPSSAAPSTSAPSSPQTSPSFSVGAFPSPGMLEVGTWYQAVVSGVPFSFAIPAEGWSSSSSYPGVILKGAGLWIEFWSPDHVFVDPCAGELGPEVGPTGADLAAALTTIPGATVTAPAQVTVGGLPANYLELTVPTGACAGNFFVFNEGGGSVGYGNSRWTTQRDSVMPIWIVDADGSRILIDAEVTGGQEIRDEIRLIVDSIQFE